MKNTDAHHTLTRLFMRIQPFYQLKQSLVPSLCVCVRESGERGRERDVRGFPVVWENATIFECQTTITEIKKSVYTRRWIRVSTQIHADLFASSPSLLWCNIHTTEKDKSMGVLWATSSGRQDNFPLNFSSTFKPQACILFFFLLFSL